MAKIRKKGKHFVKSGEEVKKTGAQRKKTGAQRMKICRERKQMNETLKEANARKLKEKLRLRALRQKQKTERSHNKGLDLELKEKERLRKQKYRETQRLKQIKPSPSSSSECITKRNRLIWKRLKRRNHNQWTEEKERLGLKINMFKNENRRLKRKLGIYNKEISESEESNTEAGDVLSYISPASKKRAKRKILLSEAGARVKRTLRLDKVMLPSPGRKSELQTKIEEFILRDENSVVVPDKKKKHFRYRLASLEILWEKFMAEERVDCSYAQFTRYIPSNIIKPKPEDWGTCLCMICLNPELKLSCLKKAMPENDITINNVHEKKRN